MWIARRALAISFLLVIAPCYSAGADQFRTFQVGNSLTWDMQPATLKNRPLHTDVGWHIKCSSALSNMLENPEAVCTDPSSFGYFTEGLGENQWDAVSLQPYSGYTTEREVESFVAMANLTNSDAEILMYATWPWEAAQANGFREEWYAGAPTDYSNSSGMSHRRSWYEYALAEARNKLRGREVNLIPAGDVWAALDTKFEQGAYAGIENAGDLYRDERHANNVGRYVAHITAWSVMHKQNPALYPELQNGFPGGTPGGEGRDIVPTAELGELIRETVWEVVSNDPLTGIVISPGDFDRDGRVDLADYTRWRDGLGSQYAPADYAMWKANFGNTSGNAASFGDFNHDGIVNLADYTVWRDGLGNQYNAADYQNWKANYGMTTGLLSTISASATNALSVPEPASSTIALFSLSTAIAFAWRRHGYAGVKLATIRVLRGRS
jgi:hypothetical protein